jgi:hypothetical protein
MWYEIVIVISEIVVVISKTTMVVVRTHAMQRLCPNNIFLGGPTLDTYFPWWN